MALFRWETIGLELEFVRFYYKAIADEIRWNTISNQHCLELVKNAYCKWTLQNGLSDVSFDSPGMRCAYIYLNTPCFSSTVAFHFSNLLRANPWLLMRTLQRGTITVCCLGGGPAAEVVAIAKVLEHILKTVCPGRGPLTIQATVVDIDLGWRETARWLRQNWWKFFDSAVVKLKLTFIQADLTQPLGEEVRVAIQDAHVVTVVKFLSAVYGTRGRDRISAMLQEIVGCIQVGGTLFFMNCTRFDCYEALSDVIVSGGNMATVYGPIRDHVYRLSGPAMEECFRFYFRYYGWLPPTQQSKNHVTAWFKSK